jgi:hypothetical protein
VLDNLSLKKVLDRGFAVLYGGAGKLITSAKKVEAGQALEIELSDGRIKAYAGAGAGFKKPSITAPKKKNPPKDDKQGRLL